SKPSLDRDKLELAVIENIQRENLNPIEEARAYSRLQDEFKLTQREIASRLGKSREVVANRMRLLNLPSEIQEAIASGRVSESQARLLLSVDDIARQRQLFSELMRSEMSVRELKAKVSGTRVAKDVSHEESGPVFLDPETEAMKEQLEEFLGTEVDLNRKGGSGKISINFYSAEELNGILSKILKQDDAQSL
ncbi:MAG: ParB/RepB/Spo0J family partition protein, partial [Patescibacteria group bacterium]|nr:ParB/RepB/Spo0J family partition protein [Patescibacteria group bacterium]